MHLVGLDKDGGKDEGWAKATDHLDKETAKHMQGHTQGYIKRKKNKIIYKTIYDISYVKQEPLKTK